MPTTELTGGPLLDDLTMPEGDYVVQVEHLPQPTAQDIKRRENPLADQTITHVVYYHRDETVHLSAEDASRLSQYKVARYVDENNPNDRRFVMVPAVVPVEEADEVIEKGVTPEGAPVTLTHQQAAGAGAPAAPGDEGEDLSEEEARSEAISYGPGGIKAGQPGGEPGGQPSGGVPAQ